jgi:hypothetical protein
MLNFNQRVQAHAGIVWGILAWVTQRVQQGTTQTGTQRDGVGGNSVGIERGLCRGQLWGTQRGLCGGNKARGTEGALWGRLAQASGRPALPHALPHDLPHEAWDTPWDTPYLMGGVVSYSQAGSLDCCHITLDEPTRVKVGYSQSLKQSRPIRTLLQHITTTALSSSYLCYRNVLNIPTT